MSRFINKNNNPKGKRTGDCTIRAFTELTNKSIEEIILELTAIYIKTGYFIDDPKCYDKWLKNIGYEKQKQVKKYDNTKYTGGEFCMYLNTLGTTDTIVAHIGGHHITTFVYTENGYMIQDTWDCTHKCVGNWWKRVK